MCAVSMVFDQYRPYIPHPDRIWPVPPTTVPPVTIPYVPPTKIVIDTNLTLEIQELRELIESFRQAIEAAEAFDRLTGQPDCVDPEKAKLEERVAELEARLDAIAEAASAE